MYRATNEKYIDAVITTLNVIGEGTSIISTGDIKGCSDMLIVGDLTVNGVFTAGTTVTTIPSFNVTHTPLLPLTGVNVQSALDQVSGLIHDQNTDTVLAEGTALEVGVESIHAHINQYTELINIAGGIIIPFTNADITFDTQTFISPDYSHGIGTAPITFNQSGVYQVHYRTSTIITSGTNRVNTEFSLELNSGGGFNLIPGSTTYTDNRTTGSGSSSTQTSILVTIIAGQTLKLVCRKIPVHTTTSTVQLTPSSTSIMITRMN
jgi:hypothetical protein